MKRNVWRPILTDTGLSSSRSRSHVNTPLVLIPSAKLDDAVPFSLTKLKIIIGKILQSMNPHRRMKSTAERGGKQGSQAKGI